MLVGAYPFEDPEDTKNFRKTMTVVVITLIISSIVSFFDVLMSCLDSRGSCQCYRNGLTCCCVVQRITIRGIRNHPWFLKNLPRSLTESAQAVYYKRDNTAPTYSLQSVDEIMKIVEEARRTPASPAPAAGFAWAKEDELEEGKHENQDTGVEEEEDDDEYDKRVKEVS
ncbi:hypothetical protein BHM03_00001034 [Ensete ventricosum]|uniref:Protein kinase domain-containing protein n=1 Tax=Ensete ventricosum TaxID=4639 RepID=A0A445M8U0_ENSVE|nr:hypothetical protein BHM03_00001034 [Ensete ventricosum]